MKFQPIGNEIRQDGTIIEQRWNHVKMAFFNQQMNCRTIMQRRQNVNIVMSTIAVSAQDKKPNLHVV